MNSRKITWPLSVKNKLIQYRSEHFTPEETLDFISEIIWKTEDLLNNPILSGTYTEENGKYRGVSRIVVRKFRVYFEWYDDEVLIIAILFPGEK